MLSQTASNNSQRVQARAATEQPLPQLILPGSETLGSLSRTLPPRTAAAKSQPQAFLLPEFVLFFFESTSISDLRKILWHRDSSPNNVPAEKALPRALNPLPEKTGLKPPQMRCLTHPKQRNPPSPGRPSRVSASFGRSSSAEGVTMPAETEAAVGSCRQPAPQL